MSYKKQTELEALIGDLTCACQEKAFFAGLDIAKKFLMK